MKSKILIVLIAYLTVVMILMRTGFWDFLVTFCILVDVVLPVFGEIFVVFCFPLLLDFPKFFSHELSLALIDDWTETVGCACEIKTENVKFGLERLLSHFSGKSFRCASRKFLGNRYLVSATFGRTYTG